MRFPHQEHIQSKFNLYSFSSLSNDMKRLKSETYNSRSKKLPNFNEYLYSHKNVHVDRNDEAIAIEAINKNNEKHGSKSINDKIPNSLPLKVELRLKLLSKIGECRSRKLISASEEKRFTNLLSDTKSNGNLEKDQAVLHVRKELDQIILKHRGRHGYKNNQNRSVKEEARHQKKSVDLSKKINSKQFISSLVSRPNNYLQFQNHSFGTHQTKSKTQNHHNDSTHGNIMDIITLESVDTSQISQETIEKLFVEMCFFARFGFAQPPCCLSCAYEMGKAKNVENENPNVDMEGENNMCGCSQLIIWRKNANIILNPDNMKRNIVFISCKAAKCLLNGGIVKDWKWNSTKHLMVNMS